MKAGANQRVAMGTESEEGLLSPGVFSYFVKIMVQLLWAKPGPVQLSLGHLCVALSWTTQQ